MIGGDNVAQNQLLKALNGDLGVDVLSREMARQATVNQQKKEAKQNNWQKILSQMAMAQKVNPQTAAGLAVGNIIGNLLRQGVDSWVENAHAREAEKDYADYQEREKNPLGSLLKNLGFTESTAQNTPATNVNPDLLGLGSAPWENFRQQAADAILPIPRSQEELLGNKVTDYASDNAWQTNLPWYLQQQREELPTDVLGTFQYIEGDNVVDDGGQAQGYQIPIANGTNTNQAWRDTPLDTSNYRPATAEDYARVRANSGATLDDWREYLSNWRNWQPQLQQEEPTIVAGAMEERPAEQPDTNEEISRGVLEASRTALDPKQYNTSSFMQHVDNMLNPNRTPDPEQSRIAREILEQKRLYDTAPEGATGDAQRYAAHQEANFLREVGRAAGLDVDNYGEDVTRANAASNLMSRQARDIASLFGGDGKYSMSSDQYYAQKYSEAIQSGLSARRAKNLAGRLAREYQANRVAYMDATLNSYGIDNLLMTPQGNRLLAQLAKEDPMTANFYYQTYPNARDAYARRNKVEDDERQHRFGFENRADEHKYREAEADSTFNRLVKQMELQFGYNKQLAEIAAANAMRQTEMQHGYDMSKMGMQHSNAKDLIDYQISKGIKGNSALKTLQEAQKNIADYRKALLEPYKNSVGGMEAVPDEVKNQIADLDEQWDILNRQIMGATGNDGSQGQQAVPKFTGDFTKDSQIINALRQEGTRRGMSWQQIKQAVYQQMLRDGCYEPYARGAVGLD